MDKQIKQVTSKPIEVSGNSRERIGVDNQIGQVIEVNSRSLEVSCDSEKKIRVDNQIKQ
jgi:hypothetical protein